MQKPRALFPHSHLLPGEGLRVASPAALTSVCTHLQPQGPSRAQLFFTPCLLLPPRWSRRQEEGGGQSWESRMGVLCRSEAPTGEGGPQPQAPFGFCWGQQHFRAYLSLTCPGPADWSHTGHAESGNAFPLMLAASAPPQSWYLPPGASEGPVMVPPRSRASSRRPGRVCAGERGPGTFSGFVISRRDACFNKVPA